MFCNTNRCVSVACCFHIAVIFDAGRIAVGTLHDCDILIGTYAHVCASDFSVNHFMVSQHLHNKSKTQLL